MIRISSPFGVRIDPVTRAPGEFHRGIDIPVPIGTPVLCAYPGTVARVDVAGVERGVVNGNAVHVVGPTGWRWSYLHLARALVRPGAFVGLGDLLGLSGSSGKSTGPHLHFAVTVDGEPVDPVPLFPGVFYGP